MWVGLGYGVCEAQLKVLAPQWAFSVVLDHGIHTGKVKVWRQVEIIVSSLRTRSDTTVLDSSTAPEIHTEDNRLKHIMLFYKLKAIKGTKLEQF